MLDRRVREPTGRSRILLDYSPVAPSENTETSPLLPQDPDSESGWSILRSFYDYFPIISPLPDATFILRQSFSDHVMRQQKARYPTFE